MRKNGLVTGAGMAIGTSRAQLLQDERDRRHGVAEIEGEADPPA